MDAQQGSALGAMLTQVGPFLTDLYLKVAPLLDQPVIRFPYNFPLSQSQVIPPGQSNVVLFQPDFNYNLEWPFEIEKIGFSQDPAHTTRDWRVSFMDQTFNQPWQKSNTGILVATLLDTNTDKYVLKWPWPIRPKGGGLQIVVTNLDTVNPITIDLNIEGSQLVPRGQMPR